MLATVICMRQDVLSSGNSPTGARSDQKVASSIPSWCQVIYSFSVLQLRGRKVFDIFPDFIHILIQLCIEPWASCDRILFMTSFFSRRFIKWNATTIVTFFNPYELTKIVLRVQWNNKAPNCTICPRGQKYNSFFKRNIQNQTRLKGPPFHIFLGLRLSKNFHCV